MAIERIPCGGWYVDDITLTFDENKVLSVVGGGSGGDYLSLDGGMMSPDAVISGEDTLER